MGSHSWQIKKKKQIIKHYDPKFVLKAHIHIYGVYLEKTDNETFIVDIFRGLKKVFIFFCVYFLHFSEVPPLNILFVNRF